MSALMPGHHATCPGLHSAVAVVQAGRDATVKSGRNNNSGPVQEEVFPTVHSTGPGVVSSMGAVLGGEDQSLGNPCLTC